MFRHESVYVCFQDDVESIGQWAGGPRHDHGSTLMQWVRQNGFKL